VQKELEGGSQSVVVACTKIYLVQIWSHVSSHTRPSRVFVYTLHTYYWASFNVPFSLHSEFFCILVLNVSTADISVSGPPPPTGTGSFIKSEEFCFLLLLLHRFLGFLGSGLLAPLAVGWYFEEYRAMVTFLDYFFCKIFAPSFLF